MKAYFYIILLALVFFSCEEKNTDDTKGSKEVVDSQLKYMDSLKVVKQHPAWDTDAAAYKFEYSFLRFALGNGDKGEKIDRICYDILADNSYIGDLDSNAYNSCAKDMINQFQEARILDPEFSERWTLNAEMMLSVHRNNILGVKMVKTTQMGQKPESEHIRFLNFKVNEGRILTIDDIIAEEHYDEFEKIAESSFRKRYEIQPGTAWERTPFVMFMDGFKLNDNFLILETGLLFVFNPFDAGIVEGQQYEMIVTWKSIEHLIPETSIVKNFISQT